MDWLDQYFQVSSRRAASLDGPKPDEAEVDNKLQRVEVSFQAARMSQTGPQWHIAEPDGWNIHSLG